MICPSLLVRELKDIHDIFQFGRNLQDPFHPFIFKVFTTSIIQQCSNRVLYTLEVCTTLDEINGQPQWAVFLGKLKYCMKLFANCTGYIVQKIYLF